MTFGDDAPACRKTRSSPRADLEGAIRRATAWLLSRRVNGAHWSGFLDADVLATALCTLQRQRHGLLTDAERRGVVRFLVNRRGDDGTWPTCPGGPPDTDVTLLAYVALRFLGCAAGDPALARTRRWLLDCEAMRSASYLAKCVVQFMDPRIRQGRFRLPVPPALLPAWAPLSAGAIQPRMGVLYDALLLMQRFPVDPPEAQRAASEAVAAELGLVLTDTPAQTRGPRRLPAWARRILRHILDAQEPDGAWGGWGLETVAAVAALEAAGLPDSHPAVARGLRALSLFDRDTPEGRYSQPCTSSVWDTLWALIALAGIEGEHVAPALAWLQDRRMDLGPAASGWGFEEGNTRCPDVDDTAVMVGLAGILGETAAGGEGCRRAVRWLLRRQNWHGGWPSFERRLVPLHVPLRRMGLEDLDYGCEDITARVVWALGRLPAKAPAVVRAVRRGVRWLRRRQRRDGSWFGWWGVHYLYGTAFALWALRSVGWDPRLPWLRRGVRFLLARQRPDGGWGESCASAWRGEYVGLGRSVPSLTGLCLMALLAHLPGEHTAVRSGLRFLTESQDAEGRWRDGYPTSVLLARRHYAEYELPATHFPLVALRMAADPAYRARLLL